MEQCSFSTILKKSSKYQVLCSCVDDYILSLLVYIYTYMYMYDICMYIRCWVMYRPT